MTIDITTFNILNVIDTCAIDNLLSSNTLYIASINSNCKFCYTKFVEYEMFFKERKNSTPSSEYLIKRLKEETQLKRFECFESAVENKSELATLPTWPTRPIQHARRILTHTHVMHAIEFQGLNGKSNDRRSVDPCCHRIRR